MNWIIKQPARPHGKLRTAAALSVALVSIVGIAAFAQQKGAATGKAQVVERRGPELPIAANAGGQVVVLFPLATANAGGQGGNEVEVVFVESNVPAAQEGQPAPAPQSTGREIVFSTRDANEGVVRHTFDNAGGARKVMILARVGGKYVEARQSGGGEGVTVFTVAQPAPEAPAPAPAADPAAPAVAPPAEGQPPAAPATPSQPTQPAQAAVIIVYTGGAAAR